MKHHSDLRFQRSIETPDFDERFEGAGQQDLNSSQVKKHGPFESSSRTWIPMKEPEKNEIKTKKGSRLAEMSWSEQILGNGRSPASQKVAHVWKRLIRKMHSPFQDS